MTPDLNLHDGDVASTPAEKASALNDFLQLVLVLTSLFHHWPVRNYIPHLHPLDCPIEFLCSEEEMFETSVTLIRQRLVGLTASQIWCLNILLPHFRQSLPNQGCRTFSKLFFQVFVCVFLMYFDNCSFLHVWSFSVYVGCSEFNCQGARASLQLGIQFLWFHCSMTCIVCTMLCVDVYHSYNPLTDHCIIILTHRQCQTFSWCCGLNLSSHTQSVS